MGSFLCVAQGTTQDPQAHHARVSQGRRRTRSRSCSSARDSASTRGGISIKPAQGMEWMKFDMCGAAGVLGAMEAIGRLELPINVVGLIGSTTNMPSGEAMKPGDVVQASNGKFIEIINTDAEGRLVLADVLAFAKRLSPAAVIDAATLTGACVIALGHTATGVMGNDDALVQEVLDAGKARRRARLAAAAVGRLQGADQVRRRRHQEFGRPAGGHDHRRAVPEGVRRRLSMGASRHRRNGVHGIGSRHGAARPDGSARGNVRGIRARASALTTACGSRACMCCGIGLGLSGRGRFAGAARRAGARHDQPKVPAHPDTSKSAIAHARRLAAARQLWSRWTRSARAHPRDTHQGADRARRGSAASSRIARRLYWTARLAVRHGRAHGRRSARARRRRVDVSTAGGSPPPQVAIVPRRRAPRSRVLRRVRGCASSTREPAASST